MTRFKSIVLTLKASVLFPKASWGYIAPKSKMEAVIFLVKVAPAWVRFTVSLYKDYRSAQWGSCDD